MDKTYFQRFNRAISDTSWLAWRRPVAVGLLSGFLSSIWLEKNLMEQIIILICITLAAGIIIPLIEFSYNFIKAPIWIARERIEKLENELRDAKAEILQLKESSKAPDLTFETSVPQDSLVTPQGSRVGMSLIAELKIKNNSQFGATVT